MIIVVRLDKEDDCDITIVDCFLEGLEEIRMTGKAVKIRIDSLELEGSFDLPDTAKKKIVIFAHGSGSSRLSPRNKQVADVLRKAGFGTLLFDLLTEE